MRLRFLRSIGRRRSPSEERGREWQQETGAEAVRPAPETTVGHLDSFRGGRIDGWVWSPGRPNEALEVEAAAGAQILALARADLFRADLAAAAIGSGHHAYTLALPPDVLVSLRASGDTLEVRTREPTPHRLGTITLSEVAAAFPPAVRTRLEPLLAQIAKPEVPCGRLAPPPLPSRPSYLSLVEPDDAGRCGPPSLLSPYAEHLRARHHALDCLPVSSDGIGREHFHRLYLDTYAASRSPLRAPLSASEIAYLNTAVTVGGSRHPLPRAAFWYILDDDRMRASLRLNDDFAYRRVSAWWACEKAPALGVEDCLVSGYQVAFLQAVGGEWAGEVLPLSRFVEERLLRDPYLPLLGHPASPATRAAIYFTLLVVALEAPGTLRFVPSDVIQRFLFSAEPLFDLIARRSFATSDGAPSAQHLVDALRTRGFDLATMRFRTITAERHRVEAARLSPAPTAAVPVQVIGPFGRASGIATAARSSRDALLRADVASRFTEFALDNPQPHLAGEGGEDVPAAADVNIIHVNADLLPVAFAYLPDVFSRAYNVGFVFWELDRVAEAHRLGLRLLDEVWVASEYNRRCFEAATDKPVVNMGLCMPELAEPDRVEARRFLRDRFGLGGEAAFVVCATYDSLSYAQRKNPIGLVRAFQDAFAGESDARLLIKTHNASMSHDPAQVQIWRSLLEAAEGDARIVFLDRTLPADDVRLLTVGCDCYASLHRSEGFGLGMLEAMWLGTPVLCTAYGGNLDFCAPETAWLVDCDEISVRATDYAYVAPGSLWAEPRHESAVAAFRAVRSDEGERQRRAGAGRSFVRERYGVDAAAERYARRLGAIDRRRDRRDPASRA